MINSQSVIKFFNDARAVAAMSSLSILLPIALLTPSLPLFSLTFLAYFLTFFTYFMYKHDNFMHEPGITQPSLFGEKFALIETIGSLFCQIVLTCILIQSPALFYVFFLTACYYSIYVTDLGETIKEIIDAAYEQKLTLKSPLIRSIMLPLLLNIVAMSISRSLPHQVVKQHLPACILAEKVTVKVISTIRNKMKATLPPKENMWTKTLSRSA